MEQKNVRNGLIEKCKEIGMKDVDGAIRVSFLNHT